ncbi:MAG: S1C family serine protease [Janthinobacterium lividum]
MKKLQKLIIISFFLQLFTTNITLAVSQVTSKSLEKIEKAIVIIETRIAVSAYHDPGSLQGTGFITDKENGLIVTNHHVVGGASVGTYFVTFHDGRQVQAKSIYYDLWQDYAILRVDPTDLPSSVEQILFSKDTVKPGQDVYVVGSPEGEEFSYHTGHVSSLYDIRGTMPQCSYVVNLNSAGGASGSPLLNEKDEAIGVIYGGSKTYALALHGEYVQSALDYLKKGEIPPRKHNGIMCEQYSLDKATRHRYFPKDEMSEYIKKFPYARNKVVAVRSILAGSIAENIMEPGDIIWEVDGKPLGGNLALLDMAMDKASDEVEFTVFRDGKKLKLKSKLYNINGNKIHQIINFAGAIFFQADDVASALYGVPLNSLSIRNVQTGSSFSSIPLSFTQNYRNLYRLRVKAINNVKVSNMKELIGVIPNAIEQKFVSIRFKNYQPYYPTFESDNGFVSSQQEFITDISFDSIDTKPHILKFDQKMSDWISEDIVITPATSAIAN